MSRPTLRANRGMDMRSIMKPRPSGRPAKAVRWRKRSDAEAGGLGRPAGDAARWSTLGGDGNLLGLCLELLGDGDRDQPVGARGSDLVGVRPGRERDLAEKGPGEPLDAVVLSLLLRFFLPH